MKVEDIPFVNMMKKIMKILDKTCDKATHEKDQKGNENIDDVVNDYANYIHMNKEVHDGFELFNEGVTKDSDLCNLSHLMRILC